MKNKSPENENTFSKKTLNTKNHIKCTKMFGEWE